MSGAQHPTALAAYTPFFIHPHPAIFIPVVNFIDTLIYTYSTAYAAVRIPLYSKGRGYHLQVVSGHGSSPPA